MYTFIFSTESLKVIKFFEKIILRLIKTQPTVFCNLLYLFFVKIKKILFKVFVQAYIFFNETNLVGCLIIFALFIHLFHLCMIT